MNFRIGFSISTKNEMGILIRILLNLYIAFDRMVMFTTLILQVHEHGCLSVYFLTIKFLVFFSTWHKLSHSIINFSLGSENYFF